METKCTCFALLTPPKKKKKKKTENKDPIQNCFQLDYVLYQKIMS